MKSICGRAGVKPDEIPPDGAPSGGDLEWHIRRIVRSLADLAEKDPRVAMNDVWRGSGLDWLGGRIVHRGASDAILALDGPPLSFAGLGDRIRAAVARLNECGIHREDRVAFALPDGPATATTCLAVSAGATCAPLSPASTTTELERMLPALGARLVLAPPDPAWTRLIAWGRPHGW